MKNLYFVVPFLVILLVASGCSKNHSIPGDQGRISAVKNKTFFEEVGQVYPYNANALYAKSMSECIYVDNDEKACALSKLPLLGISKDKITIQDILDRTLISHDFLGESFKQVLLRIPPETLELFGSVSAIVISDKINPSFYFSVTGAIYLSGRYFWRTQSERQIVSITQDDREDMGLPLQFIFTNDYIKNGSSLSSRARPDVQNYDEMTLKSVRLLFHELTHANDFIPKDYYKSEKIDINKTYPSIAFELYQEKQMPSLRLPSAPSSQKLKDIAQVLFHGVQATKEDSATLPIQIVQEFANDTATDLYSFSNPMEDLAMCVEESLMLYYYNISRYVVVIELPMPYYSIPEDFTYPIIWGEKNRVTKSDIKKRAVFAVENVLTPAVAEKVSTKLDKYIPKEIPANTSWDTIYKL